jgi:tetratricopeptide (TPR) repeat protein
MASGPNLPLLRVPYTMSAVRRRAPLVGVAVFVTALMAGFAPARAEDAQKARDLFQQGTTYYDLGQFDKAIEAWQAGYREKADPGFLYNIAQAYRVAGDAQKAIFFYKGYLRNSPKAHNRVEVEQKVAALQKQLDDKAGKPLTPPGPPPPGATAPPVSPRPPLATTPPPAASRPPVATTPPAAITPPPANTPAVVVTSPPPPTFTEPNAGPPPVIATEAPVTASPDGRIDVLAALGTDVWSSGVQGTANPSFAFTLGAGYRFGDPTARYRFRMGALFGYTFLSEEASKEHFLSFLLDPTLEVRLADRWLLTADFGLGFMAITGLEPSSALLVHTPGDTLMIKGAQSLGLVRLGVGVHYEILPELSLFVWPAIASSPKKEHFYKQITRTEILAGAAYRF